MQETNSYYGAVGEALTLRISGPDEGSSGGTSLVGCNGLFRASPSSFSKDKELYDPLASELKPDSVTALESSSLKEPKDSKELSAKVMSYKY